MAKAKRSAAAGKRSAKSARFIVSDSRAPKVALRPGMRLHVQSVTLVDSQLRALKKRIAGRLCGGGGTCIALIDVGSGEK